MQDPNPNNHSIDAIHKAPVVSIQVGTPKPKNRKRHWLRIFVILTIIAVSIGTTYALTVAHQWSAGSFVGQKSNSFFGNALDLIRGTTGQAPIDGEETGHINILLLGIGGEGHDGPYLSDTIILAQINLDTNEVALTSIPRDYQVKLPKNFGFRKINAAFAEGYNLHKDWNEAGSLATGVVSELSGIKVNYFAVVDFSGFEQAINQIGGLDVVVDRTFTDYQYPDNKDGYLPPQAFTQGSAHMDGQTALIFARSRHAAGPEGSDFSRSQRQQKIITAFREKVQQLNLVADSGQIASLLHTFASHFHTNLTPGQLLRLTKIAQKTDRAHIVSTSLDPDTGLICSEITEDTKAYVLVPCYSTTTDDIRSFFANAQYIGKLREEKSVVWIATSNPKSNAYRRIEAVLQSSGLTVWPISYNDLEPTDSVIYEINKKPATADYLKTLLTAREVTLPPPNIKIDSTRSDIILILGLDLPERFTKPLPPAPTQTPAPSVTPSPVPTTKPVPIIKQVNN